MKLSVLKKHFSKYGLSEKALGEIYKLMQGQITDQSTDEQIIELCKGYEPLAKVFQSEMDALRTKGKGQQDTGAEQNTSATETKQENDLFKLIADLKSEIQGLKKEQTASVLLSSAKNRLKEAKFTEKEIEAILLGRSFENEEGLNDFITKQTALYEEITKERLETQAGSGTQPPTGSGKPSEQTLKNDFEAFNKMF